MNTVNLYTALSAVFIPFTVGYISFIVYIGARNSSFSVTMRSLSKDFRDATNDARKRNIQEQLIIFSERFQMNNDTLKKLNGSIKYFILFILLSSIIYFLAESKSKDIFYIIAFIFLIIRLITVYPVSEEIIKEIDRAKKTIDLEIEDVLKDCITSSNRTCVGGCGI